MFMTTQWPKKELWAEQATAKQAMTRQAQTQIN